jgi:hypothetical protein
MYKTFPAALIATALSIEAVAPAPAVSEVPPDAAPLNTIKAQFGRLMELANNHDLKAAHKTEIALDVLPGRTLCLLPNGSFGPNLTPRSRAATA